MQYRCMMRLLWICFVTFTWAEAANQSMFGQMSPECQPYLPKTSKNLSDPLVLQEMKRATIRASWDRPLLQKETPLLNRLKDIILRMAESDSLYFTELVTIYTGWGSGYLSNAEHLYPSFCSMAKAINKTVEWYETKKNALYNETLYIVNHAVTIGLSGIKYATLKELGCKNISVPLEDERGCWKNGFSAANEELWNIFGTLLPWTLRDTISKLMDSCDFTEKAAAIIFNFMLVPPVSYFWIDADSSLFVQSSTLFSQSTNNSFGKCCCDDWSINVDDVTRKIMNVVDNATVTKTEEIKNEC